MKTSFIGLLPSESIVKEVLKLRRDSEFNLVEIEKLPHITVLPPSITDRYSEEEIEKVIKNIVYSAISIDFKELKFFSNHLVIEIESDELHFIHRKLIVDLGYKPGDADYIYNNYTPHLTLMKFSDEEVLSENTRIELLSSIDLASFKNFTSSNICIFEKIDTEYAVESVFNLE